ncbi:uncharacterized protein LOC112157991 isoform X2 [Oryzias melastigma]|uniref:uncharacterized protein LOC112157991 isoform X2 n=1 Tax=Oryzias melastigma TaxID=30732 RepID=UPI000CF82A35|nr:uncharacterized protein LOC112157991 isoform X2 [Oryzias melastigma]
MEEAEALMEEQVDQGMEEAAHSFLERPSPKESFNSDSLLAPDADFMTDDRSSAASGLDVADRLTYLEQRMQMQEDEIQLLKMALADVLKRLSISEEQQAAGRRAAGLRARPVSLALPPRPPMVTSPLKKCPTMPSCSTPRSFSPTPSRSGVKSPPGSVKDSPCKSTARPAAKKTPDAKSKEPASVGTRRVTHCKGRRCPSAPSNELSCRIQPLYFSIFHFSRLTMTCVSPFDLSTPRLCLHSWSPSLAFLAPPPLRPSPLHLVTMQIYLSPLARKTGSSEAAASAAAARADRGPAATPVKTPRPNESRKATPSFTLNLQKSSQSSTQDISSYKSPTKSPSQYFQICY